MPTFSAAAKRKRQLAKGKFKVMGDHDRFLSRIEKSLYYGKLPLTERFSFPVSELAAELFSEVKSGRSLDHLQLGEAATISRNSCVSPCSLVLALLYLERLKTCNPEYLRSVPSSELFVVSMMVASKFLNDDGEEEEVFNDEWAAATGFTLKELNRIEHDFLQAIDWEVFVSEQAFWRELHQLEAGVARQEGCRRGWFSYADLNKLLDTVDLAAMVQALIKVSTVCLTGYTASVLTLLGSMFIASHIPGTSLNTRPEALSTTTDCNLLLGHRDPPGDNSSGATAPTTTTTTTTSFILASISSYDQHPRPSTDLDVPPTGHSGWNRHFDSGTSRNCTLGLMALALGDVDLGVWMSMVHSWLQRTSLNRGLQALQLSLVTTVC